MKRCTSFIMIAALPILLAFCASTQPALTISSVNIPELTEMNYKQIDTSAQVVGIYLYNAKLGADQVALGDSNANAFREVLEPKVKFYRLNVAELSVDAQKELAQKYLGEPTLPSYIFIYNNKLVAKKIGSYNTSEDAIKGAEEIKKGLEATVWRRK